MKNYDMKKIYSFLSDLDKNNNKEWFAENKLRYEDAKTNFENFVDVLGFKMEEVDEKINYTKAKDYTYRIYKDVRFSKDKTPYKNNFGAYINYSGKKSNFAGYYIHIQPDTIFFGGGLHMPLPEILKIVRNEIYYSSKQLKEIIENKQFKKLYPEIISDKLMRVPKDFPKDCDAADLLKYKGLAVIHNVEINDFLSENFVDKIIEGFKILKPLNEFINNAIKNGLE